VITFCSVLLLAPCASLSSQWRNYMQGSWLPRTKSIKCPPQKKTNSGWKHFTVSVPGRREPIAATLSEGAVLVFTARRNDSAVYAVVVCPSVRPSQAGIVSKRLDESSLILARVCALLRKNWVSPKIGVLLPGTLSHTPDIENFATASRSRCRKNSSSSSSSTVELVDDTYTTIDESWLFTTSRPNCNPLTPICCGFVIQLVSTVYKILTDIARRAVRLR